MVTKEIQTKKKQQAFERKTEEEKHY